jgi:uncharacterized SAM-binding protein YcdF (DUF218 family)
MFTLSKLLPLLLLPPGLFLLLAGVALLLVRRRRRRAASWLLAGLTLLLYLLSIQPVADALLLPLEDRYPPLTPGVAACRAVVLLGGSIVPASPEAGGAAVPGVDSLARSLAALRIWRETGAPIIATGYGEWPELPSAAEVMAQALLAWRVPEAALSTETESRNTFENARYTAPILKERGLQRVCLVTSAYHLRRAVLAFAIFQVRAIPFPTHYLASRVPATWRSYLPTMGALARSGLALREYVGLLYYHGFYGA